MPRIEVTGDIYWGGQGSPRAVEPMMKMIVLIVFVLHANKVVEYYLSEGGKESK